ncbi:MAG: tetratricopeptide repeat protein [Bacteroidia bacterium]
MKKILLLILISRSLAVHSQTVADLYEKRDYKELVKYEKKAAKLTGEELYMVGYAFFQMEEDEKAISFYDKAIAKGLDSAGVHFYKGLSLRYLKKYDEAMKEVEIALKAEPQNQEYMNEKGVIYYEEKDLDHALEVFEAAKALPPTYPEPFFWAARIYDEKGMFSKALDGYYEASRNLDPESSSYYLSSLMAIGRLEYSEKKNYVNSMKAYLAALKLDPENYEIHSWLMRDLNAAKMYAKADSIFEFVRKVYENGKLPEEDMKIGTIAIADFEWNGQMAQVRRSFKEPKETLDVSYKVFLLDKAGENVVRRFLVEKTTPLSEHDAKHLLCENDKEHNTHITYPYGWETDTIPLESLIKGVVMVLDGKMKQGASSTPGN